MAFSQRLDLRQGQSLVMTPQLQQAIKLLQLSNIELAAYVEQELERNPLLQRDDSENEPETSDYSDAGENDYDKRDNEEFANAQNNLDAPSEDAYESDGPSESAIAAHGSSSAGSGAGATGQGSGRGGGEDVDFESILSSEKSLREHLKDQLAMAGLNEVDQLIAAQLIDETDEGGYLRADLDQTAEMLGVDTEHLMGVLTICQGFEPTGVMARSIEECLALQLGELNRLDPAMQTLLENLHLVAKHDLHGLAHICGVDRADVLDMITEIKALTPRPGAAFAGDAAQAVVPDVFIRELPYGAFGVELNSDTLPRVLMDRTYYGEVSKVAKRDQEKEFIEECAANANWLIKSLDQRARTILKVSQEVVRQQDAFFVHGVAHLRPLNLKTVADAIGMHESTVSRVTSNKYMSSPRGMFELKYFFSAAIPSTGEGEAHSAEAVRHRIKSLIESETLDTVLSDDQLVDELRGFGIDIARRTVAKYRESLRIPSSVQRRRAMRQSA
ncbi:MAG: RNA polymerase sigma-54 factor [Ponticaulis sp.]|nr:RNA polymerase sigma-54 factor [Ponticaulis sp.]